MTEETRCDHCERQVVTRRYRPDERTSDRDNFRCETITHTHTRIHARGSMDHVTLSTANVTDGNRARNTDVQRAAGKVIN